MGRIVHFENAIDDPENAAEFYSAAFGWTIQKWDGPIEYWTVSTGAQETPGIDGGFFRAQDEYQGTINTIEVDSVDESLEKIIQAGGTVVRGKNAVPGIGYQAYCKDTSGVLFGIHETNPEAK